MFFLFCDCFLSRVVGYTAWKDGCTKSKVSELASITDEAFAYLLVENYWEVWSNIDLDAYKNEEAQFDERTSKRKKRKSAWGKDTRNAFGARRYSRWTNEGLLRFNALHQEVKSDRLKMVRLLMKITKHIVSHQWSIRKERDYVPMPEKLLLLMILMNR